MGPRNAIRAISRNKASNLHNLDIFCEGPRHWAVEIRDSEFRRRSRILYHATIASHCQYLQADQERVKRLILRILEAISEDR